MSEPLITKDEADDIIAYGAPIVARIISDYEPKEATMVLLFVVCETMLRMGGNLTMTRLELFDTWSAAVRKSIADANDASDPRLACIQIPDITEGEGL